MYCDMYVVLDLVVGYCVSQIFNLKGKIMNQYQTKSFSQLTDLVVLIKCGLISEFVFNLTQTQNERFTLGLNVED